MKPVKKQIINVINKGDEEIGKQIDSSLRLDIEDDFQINDVWGHSQSEVESLKRVILEGIEGAFPKKSA